MNFRFWEFIVRDHHMLSELKLCFIPFALSRLLFFAVVIIVASNIKTELPARGGSIYHVEAGLKY